LLISISCVNLSLEWYSLKCDVIIVFLFLVRMIINDFDWNVIIANLLYKSVLYGLIDRIT